MKKCSMIAILVLMFSLLAQGEVDWERRVVTASGIGAPDPNAPNMAVKRAGAINAAKMYAVRDLLATIKGMYLTSEQTVENYMTTDDVIKTHVEGIARSFQMVGEPEYFEDGSVEVTVEMSIDGDLSALVMKDQTFGDTTPLVGEATYKLSELTEAGSDVYSGLIIDCSDIQLRPALSPKVLNESGKEVYGTANVNKDFAVQQGMMGYLKSMEGAKENSRVGNNPLVIKATGVHGSNKADIIISDADASRIESLSDKLNFLRECRVIALIK
ncbi:MAG: hypothetical protein R6V47_05405 [Candidatus Delongbacteria bacterium]